MRAVEITNKLVASGLVLLVLTLVPSLTFAESDWSSWHAIREIELNSTYAWVLLEGWVGPYNLGSEGCANTYGFIVDDDAGGFDVTYRTLLSAFLAGREIRVRVEADALPGDSVPCRVTRVGIR